MSDACRADRARWLGWALVAGGLAAGLFIAISAWSLWDGEPHGPPHGPLAESERSLVEIERQLVEQRPANPPDTLVDQPWSENGSERAVGPRTPSPPVVAQESVVSELERQNDERRLPGGIASQEKDLLVEPAGSGRLWAIVVGVDEYQHLPSLSFGVSDAQGLVRTLRQFGDIPADRILLITDATGMKPTRDVLLEQIPRWLQNCQPQDTLLFFFSGHGVIHPRTQRMYLASADCRIDDIGQSAVGISRIRQLLARCAAKTKILLLDCCHSGALKGPHLDGKQLTAAFEETPGVITLASCQGNEVSVEWKEKGHGLFTYWLLQGLQGAADIVPDQRIDIDELYRYLVKTVPPTARDEFNVRQTRVRSIGPDVVGIPVVLCLNAAPPEMPAPVPLPEESVEIAQLPLIEDFRSVTSGAVPEGWATDGSIGVQREGDFAWLSSFAKDEQIVASPPVDLRDDFVLELRLLLGTNGKLLIRLEGDESTDDLPITIRSRGGFWTGGFPEAPANRIQAWKDKANLLRLVREKGTYRLLINGTVVSICPAQEGDRFTRISLGLTGQSRGTFSRYPHEKLLDFRLAGVNAKNARPIAKEVEEPLDVGIFFKFPEQGPGVPDGIHVSRADKNSPAARAGLKYLDVITHVQDHPVTEEWQWHEILSRHRARGAVTVQFFRTLEKQEGRTEVRWKLP